MDFTILSFVQNHFHNRFTDKFFPFLSRLGNAGAIWFAFAAYLVARKSTRHYAVMLFFSIALAHILSQILKILIARPRPFMTFSRPLLIHTPGGYSCPSGHSASSFAAATVLCMVNRGFGFTALALALLIAFSRIFLFVHYPSDTVIGSAIGILCAILIVYLYHL